MAFNPIAGLTYIPDIHANTLLVRRRDEVRSAARGAHDRHRAAGTRHHVPPPPPPSGPAIEGPGGRGASSRGIRSQQTMRWRMPGGGGIGGGTMTTAATWCSRSWPTAG
jgi:hypothetical protein